MLPALNEYLFLLSYPSLVARYLFDPSDGWLKVFEAWNVTYTAACLLVAIVDFFLFVVFSFGFGLLALPWVFASLLGSVLSSWLGWFCIVKNKGCCGLVGLLIWGLFFLSSALGQLEYSREQKVGLLVLMVDAIKAVPAMAMAVSCLMAFQNPGQAGILGREVVRSMEKRHAQLFPKWFAEFLGTFILVFTVGSNVIAAKSVWSGVSIACALMVSIYSLGGVSGANFNPAVSLGLFLSHAFGGVGLDFATIAMYCVSQVTGACTAVVAFKLLYGEGIILEVQPGYTLAQAGCCEVLYTCMLVFVVLNVAIASKNSDNQYFGLAIGFVVIAGAYGAGPISMGCFNPAVALGLATSGGGDMHVCFAYFAYEALGAVLAAVLFVAVRGEDFGRTGGSDQEKCLSEFIGTFFLVVTVGLNVLAYSSAGALSIASALMSMIYALGSVSGAHFNPAVSAAILCSFRDPKFSGYSLCTYALAQVLGGLFGGLTYAQIYKMGLIEETPCSFPLGPQGGHSLSQAITVEAFYTFLLAYVVLCVAVSKRTRSTEMFGLAIGMCVTAGGFAVSGVSGAALNPAVSLGIAFAHVVHGSGLFANAIFYCAAELAGGLLAAIFFQVTHKKSRTQYSAMAADIEMEAAEVGAE